MDIFSVFVTGFFVGGLIIFLIINSTKDETPIYNEINNTYNNDNLDFMLLWM